MKEKINEEFTQKEGSIYLDGCFTGMMFLAAFILASCENIYFILIFSFLFLSIALYNFIFIYLKVNNLKEKFEWDISLMLIAGTILSFLIIFSLTLIKIIKPYLI